MARSMQDEGSPEHHYVVTEPSHIPLEGYLLGYGPALVLALGAIAAWALQGRGVAIASGLTSDLGLAILLFLSGVRRGLSFRSPDGPTMPQRITFFWLFGLGFFALVLQPRPLAIGLVALGFVSIGLFDWLAARKEEAPPYFARLRPPQMTIAAVSMLALLWHQIGFT